MTAAELIAKLQQVPPETLIAVYADHGQQCLRAHTAGLIGVCDIEASQFEVADEDEEDEEFPYNQVFEIGAP